MNMNVVVSLDAKVLDIRIARAVGDRGRVLWINLDTECVLRITGIPDGCIVNMVDETKETPIDWQALPTPPGEKQRWKDLPPVVLGPQGLSGYGGVATPE